MLAPDILVTQGDHARSAVLLAIKRGDISLLKSVGTTCGYGILEIGGKAVLWLHTYHPQARYNRFFIRRDRCWQRWARIAPDWYRENR